ncbi:MAG: NUDIX domain-containing protein [Lachnospiraceae bacterium]|nr:NUDIX domain-containing protein [Lachnospiraceae bacterium]
MEVEDKGVAMRELFTIDLKNYKENGTVGKRPSVRGIIIKDGKIAMMHSLKYDYYKLPGGGIEEGEELRDTLVREVKEESGLVVKKDSIREFGYVRRIEKGLFEDIFMQENYYFLCDVEDEVSSQELDDYEAEEGFTLEFVTPEQAINVNNTGDHREKVEKQTFTGMLTRENRVLQMVRAELL